jgi:hypothetical protein
MLDESQLQIVPFQINIALWRKTIAGQTHAPLRERPAAGA